MALSPKVTYPGQLNETDPGYPYGKAQNVVVAGDGTGTPWEERIVNDILGFQQALLGATKVTPSGTADKVGASQYLDAIKSLIEMAPTTKARNWPERSSITNTGLANEDVGIAYGPAQGPNQSPIFVVQPTSTRIITSPDGRDWTFTGIQSAASSVRPCVAFGQINGSPGFLMTWDNPTGFYTSVNGGVTWSNVSATLPAHGVAVYAPSLSLWVIAGDLGIIYTSPTATAGSWTARTTPAGWQSGCGGVKRAVWNGSLFVLLPLGSYNKCLTSPDGVTWAERVLGGTGIWTGLAYGTYDGLWMAIGNGLGYSTSPDGITWTLTGGPPTCNDLAVIGPTWVMATNNGSFGGIAYSINKGVNWTAVAVGDHSVATAGWKRILAADGRFIVAHDNGTSIEFAMSIR